MSRWLAIVYSVATLILFPAVATGLVLWRLTALDQLVILAGTLVSLGLGIGIMVWGLEVGQRVDRRRVVPVEPDPGVTGTVACYNP